MKGFAEKHTNELTSEKPVLISFFTINYFISKPIPLLIFTDTRISKHVHHGDTQDNRLLNTSLAADSIYPPSAHSAATARN